MQTPMVVLVNGAPCTGKTTLAAQIAADVRLPLIAKDAIKEALFDTVGWSDREWSRKLGMASIRLLFDWIAAQLAAGQSVIAECNFHRDYDAPKFAAMQAIYGCTMREVFCTAAPEVIVGRFMARWQAGGRHPGHVDGVQEAEMWERIAAGIWQPVCPPAHVLMVDTTDWSAHDDTRVLADVRRLIATD